MSTPTIEQIEYLEPIDRPTAEPGHVVCPTCDGTRSISVDSGGSEPWGASIEISIPCEHCNGTGTIPDATLYVKGSKIISW